MQGFERCVVLVADDEPVVLNLVRTALIRHGYVVIAAEDGPSALRLCENRTGPIHLALLDVMMPGMSGPELFKCLNAVHPKIAVLFMSGYRTDQLDRLPYDLKPLEFIAKPFRPRDLVHRVNVILGNSDVCRLLDDEALAS